MNRIVCIFFFLTILFWGCSVSKKQPEDKTHLKSFEFSFHRGFGRSFAFVIDSNKIFFSPKRLDTCYYGIVSDSIYKYIDTFARKLQMGNVYKTIEEPCYDCSDIAFKAIINNDTFRMHQFGKIDKEIYSFIGIIEHYIRTRKNNEISCWLQLETMSVNTVQLPKIEYPIK